jgi:hypothetical protein
MKKRGYDRLLSRTNIIQIEIEMQAAVIKIVPKNKYKHHPFKQKKVARTIKEAGHTLN